MLWEMAQNFIIFFPILLNFSELTIWNDGLPLKSWLYLTSVWQYFINYEQPFPAQPRLGRIFVQRT